MSALRSSAIIIGVTLVLLVVLELGARQIAPVRTIDEIRSATELLSGVDPPQSILPSWAKDGKCRSRSAPPDSSFFVPDRPAPLGQDLQQSSLHSYYTPNSLMMHTWSSVAFQPPSASGPIAIFGASTIAGDGIECIEHTIPSQLQRLLNNSLPAAVKSRVGDAPRVDNLGQSGFVAYNQFLLFINMLRHGYRPRLVIFYQGHNDALQRVMTASPHFNYSSYAVGATGMLTLRNTIRDSLLNRSTLIRLLSGERPRMNEVVIEGKDYKAALFLGTFGDLTAEKAMATRAKATASEMFTEAAILSHLAASYKFELLIVSYPSVFSKRNLGPNEKIIVDLARQKVPAVDLAISLTQDALHDAFQEKLPHVHYIDLRYCFRRHPEAVFKDISHLTPRGNELIAGCMLDAIAQLDVR